MTVQQTTAEPPVTLLDPTRPPRPALDCDVCAALDEQRAAFEKKKNVKRATDCEVEMRNHPNHEIKP